MIINKSYKDKFGIILFYLLLLEAFLGGGGDVFSINISGIRITLRMVLFVLTILYYLFSDHSIGGYSSKVSYIVIILLFYCFISFLIGSIRYSVSDSIKSFLTVSYLLMFFPMSSFGKKEYGNFQTITKVLLFSAIVISVFSLIINGLVRFNLISAYDLRILLSKYGSDLSLRSSGTFVYSGHIYVALAALYLFSKMMFDKKGKKLYLLLVLLFSLTIFLSLTRGLIIVFLLEILFIFLWGMKKRGMLLSPQSLGFLIVIVLGIVYAINNIDVSRLFDYGDAGVSIRQSTISDAINSIMNQDLIFGKGYGVRFESRYNGYNFEISLVDILVKQGIIGIILWVLYIIETIDETRKNYRNGLLSDVQFIFCIVTVLTIFLVSFSNPYLNNSLGIFAIFITLTINKNSIANFKR